MLDMVTVSARVGAKIYNDSGVKFGKYKQVGLMVSIQYTPQTYTVCILQSPCISAMLTGQDPEHCQCGTGGE